MTSSCIVSIRIAGSLDSARKIIEQRKKDGKKIKKCERIGLYGGSPIALKLCSACDDDTTSMVMNRNRVVVTNEALTKSIHIHNTSFDIRNIVRKKNAILRYLLGDLITFYNHLLITVELFGFSLDRRRNKKRNSFTVVFFQSCVYDIY